MPLAALYGVAGGIAVTLALAGRQLHEVLLAEALSGRNSAARMAVAAGMMLLVILLVLIGLVVAILLFARSGRDPGPWRMGDLVEEAP